MKNYNIVVLKGDGIGPEIVDEALKVLDATGGYTLPMVIFSSFGIVALLIGMLLKREDKKKGYGMELPNIKE